MEEKQEKEEKRNSKFTMFLLALLLSAFMVASIAQLPWSSQLNEIPTEEVGNELYQNYWFALIVLGFGLAAALLGGIYLAKIEAGIREKEDEKK